MASADAMSTEPGVCVEQVAQHLGVVKDTVYRRRKHQALPVHRVGRRWKCTLSDANAWLRAGGAHEGPDLNKQRD